MVRRVDGGKLIYLNVKQVRYAFNRGAQFLFVSSFRFGLSRGAVITIFARSELQFNLYGTRCILCLVLRFCFPDHNTLVISRLITIIRAQAEPELGTLPSCFFELFHLLQCIAYQSAVQKVPFLLVLVPGHDLFSDYMIWTNTCIFRAIFKT